MNEHGGGRIDEGTVQGRAPTGPYPVYPSSCLHPPESGGSHMCVYQTTWWLRGPGGSWHRVRDWRRTERWLALCESWDDVLAVWDEIAY